MKQIRFGLLALSFTACSHSPDAGLKAESARDPASSTSAASLFEARVEAQVASLKQQYAKDPSEAERTSEAVLSMAGALARDYQAKGLQEPETLHQRFEKPWRAVREQLNLVDVAIYPKESTFRLDYSGAKDYALDISNFAYLFRAPVEKPAKEKRSLGQKLLAPYHAIRGGARAVKALMDDHLLVQLSCDAPFRLRTITKGTETIPARTVHSVRLYAYGKLQVVEAAEMRDVMRLAPEVGSSCILNVRDPRRPELGWRTIYLKPESNADLVAGLRQRADTCLLPMPMGFSGPEAFFLNAKFQALSCPETIPAPVSVSNEIDALKAKVRLITGHELTDEEISLGDDAKRDPRRPLDMSNAPEFDALFVSSLVFRSDFIGQTVARALAYHADRGTKVYILTSDATQLDKDRVLLYRLVAQHPNMKLQEYRFDAPGGAPKRQAISGLHKVNHVKLIVGISSKTPERSFVVTGGRNIHDGFIFRNPDYKHIPELVNYAAGEDTTAFWRDYDAYIVSHDFAQTVGAHLLTLLGRDGKSNQPRNLASSVRVQSPAEPRSIHDQRHWVRHLMSSPATDGRALEDFYANLLDSARETVHLSSPYFRPTPKIVEAFNRAIDRGVKIEIITRLNLKGDVAGEFLGQVNKAGVNQFFDRAKIFEWIEPDVILHTKTTIVDGKLALVGSLNLNQRSFIHDLENAILVYNDAEDGYPKELIRMLKGYQGKSRHIDKAEKQTWWIKYIMNAVREEF